METNKNTQQEEENTNENANSAYSGSGSMQPGAGTGEAGRLNDYQEDDQQDGAYKKNNPEGKTLPRPLTLPSCRIFNSRTIMTVRDLEKNLVFLW